MSNEALVSRKELDIITSFIEKNIRQEFHDEIYNIRLEIKTLREKIDNIYNKISSEEFICVDSDDI